MDIAYQLVSNVHTVIFRTFGTNEWCTADCQTAQSGTSRAPHFAQGMLKKRLDQSNRQE